MSSRGSEGRASSLNGRSFDFNTAPSGGVEVGAFVSIQLADQVALGQVRRMEYEGGRVTGAGTFIGVVDATGSFTSTRPPSFSEAPMADASEDLIALVDTSYGATLEIGTLVDTDGFKVRLLPHRFNRHTFWCGQSGSGKTYALGVVLEELLLHTALPMVIFDPNADFVNLQQPAEPTRPDFAATLGARDIRVLRAKSGGGLPLRARFSTMTTAAKAAVLQLDPLVDRDEYNDLIHLEHKLGRTEPDEIIAELRAAETAGSDELATRLDNLRVAKWSVWARNDRAASEIVGERPAATVLDMGGFDYPDEALVTALSVLDALWELRNTRNPILIVIEEAHNFCSPENDRPLNRAVRERLIQIAAEGRKFGIWLLLSTQRPSKIDPNILSQCDNLALMKVSSPNDLRALGTTFGFVPQELLELAPLFRQGEALFAGGFVSAPELVRMRPRLTREGGADIAVPIRAAEPA